MSRLIRLLFDILFVLAMAAIVVLAMATLANGQEYSDAGWYSVAPDRIVRPDEEGSKTQHYVAFGRRRAATQAAGRQPRACGPIARLLGRCAVAGQTPQQKAQAAQQWSNWAQSTQNTLTGLTTRAGQIEGNIAALQQRFDDASTAAGDVIKVVDQQQASTLATVRDEFGNKFQAVEDKVAGLAGWAKLRDQLLTYALTAAAGAAGISAPPFAIALGVRAIIALGKRRRRRRRRRQQPQSAASTPSPRPGRPLASSDPTAPAPSSSSSPAAPSNYRKYAEELADLYAETGGRDQLFDMHLGRLYDEETRALADSADEAYADLIGQLRDRVMSNVRRIFTKGAERTTAA